MAWLHVGAGLAVAAIGFAGGWQVRDWKAGSDRVAQLELKARDDMRQAERVDGVAVAYEAKRAAGQQRQRIITQEVERVVEVYRDRPCLDDAGLQLVTRALGPASPASGAASAVP